MTDTEKIIALKETKKKVDELIITIDSIVNDNTVKAEQSISQICKQIEKDLEEIYELTDESVYKTRRLYIKHSSFRSYGICFDGSAYAKNFIGSEKRSEDYKKKIPYHVLICDYEDGSGHHYYEDGKWNNSEYSDEIEVIASNWALMKEVAIKKIVKAYEDSQKEGLADAMQRLEKSNERLAELQKELRLTEDCEKTGKET